MAIFEGLLDVFHPTNLHQFFKTSQIHQQNFMPYPALKIFRREKKSNQSNYSKIRSASVWGSVTLSKRALQYMTAKSIPRAGHCSRYILLGLLDTVPNKKVDYLNV